MSEIFGNLYLSDKAQSYLLFFVIVIASIIIGRVLYSFFKLIVRRATIRTKTVFDDVLVDVVEEPMVFLVFLGGLWYGFSVIEIPDSAEKIVYNILKILIILTVAFFVVRLSDGWIVEYLRQRALVSGAGKSLPAVQKIIKVVVVIVAALVIFDILELNVTSLIAGLGLGGLAVALAARDTLANLFGSVTVLTDQPFKVGDKIRIEKFEGNVEEVGLRSTRIKTGMGTRIIIPNTKLTTMIVENVSEREGKHKEFAIFLKQTVSSEKIQKAIDIIKSALNENLEMIEDKYCVSFSEISEKGPVISVSYFVKSQKGKAEIVERINFGIKKGLEKIGVELND